MLGDMPASKPNAQLALYYSATCWISGWGLALISYQNGEMILVFPGLPYGGRSLDRYMAAGNNAMDIMASQI
ncbi:hypothetical protein VNO77_18705 [Canavalia gladiata]|uniref:Uncharacterized protein n=1 Tax=Canavalia gladiata TaxID=3824 RepID=A0AAN9QKL8_CANGL